MLELEKLNYRAFVNYRRYLIGSVGLGVFAAGLVLFAVIPQAQESFALQEQLTLEREKATALQRKARELEEVTSTAYTTNIEAVNRALPSKKPLLELLASLNATSSKNQVTLSKLQLAPGSIATNSTALSQRSQRSTTEGYDLIAVEMKVTGSKADVQQFLIDIEHVAPLTTLTAIKLNTLSAGIQNASSSAAVSRELVQADIQLSSYFFTQSIQASVNAPLPKIGTGDETLMVEVNALLPTDVNEQQEITGGGLDDLFGIEGLLN